MNGSGGPRKERNRRRPIHAPLLCLLAAIGGGLISDKALDVPRNWEFDAWQRFSPATRDASDMLIIDIDPESVRRFGQWPWTRDRLASLIDRVAGARTIAIDVLLLDPDRVPFGDPDQRLSAALTRVPAVLAATTDATMPVQFARIMSGSPIFQTGADAASYAPKISGVTWPLESFTSVARGTGLAVVFPGQDGIIRRVPMIYSQGNALLPGFALEIMRVSSGASAIGVHADTPGIDEITLGSLVMRTDGDGAIRPRFATDTPARVVPAFRVLDGEPDPSVFKGRIVLVGSSLPGLGDIYMTPAGLPRTGTAIIAQLIASVAAADTLWRPAWALTIELLVLSGFGGLSLWLFGRVSGRVYAAQGVAVITLLVTGSFATFKANGLLLDWIWPVSGLLAVHVSALAARAREEKLVRQNKESELAAALREIDSARQVVSRALNSAKLATLGELATVLAHELRQPIATISMAAENAELSLEDDSFDVSDARLRLNRIIAQTKRARSMIDHLRVFGRSDIGAMEPVDLAAAVNGALVLVQPTLRKDGIRLAITKQPDVPPVMGHKVLIEQVIVNLLINARDALMTVPADRRAIDLTIETSGSDANSVCLAVTDSGPGISPEVLPRMFEPFFTTKPAGEGTGLGLAICQRIVESLGGSVAVRDGGDGGASFMVTLPAVTAPVSS